MSKRLGRRPEFTEDYLPNPPGKKRPDLPTPDAAFFAELYDSLHTYTSVSLSQALGLMHEWDHGGAQTMRLESGESESSLRYAVFLEYLIAKLNLDPHRDLALRLSPLVGQGAEPRIAIPFDQAKLLCHIFSVLVQPASSRYKYVADLRLSERETGEFVDLLHVPIATNANLTLRAESNTVITQALANEIAHLTSASLFFEIVGLYTDVPPSNFDETSNKNAT